MICSYTEVAETQWEEQDPEGLQEAPATRDHRDGVPYRLHIPWPPLAEHGVTRGYVCKQMWK
jgi:hypothetical protein